MLNAGERIPGHVRVWQTPGDGPQPLAGALGEGPVLLLFYLLDWSFT